MELADIRYEINHFSVDTTNYIGAESMRDKFKTLVERLDKKIQLCVEQLEQVKTCKDDLNSSYLSSPNSVEGEWKIQFEKKEEIWYTRINEIYSKMECALGEAIKRRDRARDLQTYWGAQAVEAEKSIRIVIQQKMEEEQKKKGEKQ